MTTDDFQSGPAITRVRLSEESSHAWRTGSVADRIRLAAKELARATEDLIQIEDCDGVLLATVSEP